MEKGDAFVRTVMLIGWIGVTTCTACTELAPGDEVLDGGPPGLSYPPPEGNTDVIVTTGGGRSASPQYRGRLVFGGPTVAGTSSSARYRAEVGAGAHHGRR